MGHSCAFLKRITFRSGLILNRERDAHRCKASKCRRFTALDIYRRYAESIYVQRGAIELLNRESVLIFLQEIRKPYLCSTPGRKHIPVNTTHYHLCIKMCQRVRLSSYSTITLQAVKKRMVSVCIVLLR